MELTRREIQRYSLARMIETIVNDKPRSGFEFEVSEAAARERGLEHDGQRPVVPWAVLATRDLTTASAAAVVATETPAPLDMLRPWSVTLRAGITVLPDLKANVALPRVATDAAGYWLPDENTAITDTQPVVGQVALTPKVAGGLIHFGRQLNLMPTVDSFLRTTLLRVVGRMVDVAVLGGSGNSGQPTGIANAAGVATQAGAALSWAGACNMLERAAVADADDDRIRFIGTPGVREILQGRERASGSGFIWDNDKVAGKPAHATTTAPASTLIAGDWSQAVLGVFGPGPVIELDPYSGFRTGRLSMRVLVDIDVGLATPGAFCVAGSVS